MISCILRMSGYTTVKLCQSLPGKLYQSLEKLFNSNPKLYHSATHQLQNDVPQWSIFHLHSSTYAPET